jgi:hypothetical protein
LERIFAIEKGLSKLRTNTFRQGKGNAATAYSHNEHPGMVARDTPPLLKAVAARLSR